jgi:hypothetical protein
MTEAHSLEDKISNIRKAIRNLTGEAELEYGKDLQPSLLKNIDSGSSRDSQKSLEQFLEEKYEQERVKTYKSPVDCASYPGFDYTKDEENFSRTSFKYMNNKASNSFGSDEIKDYSSLKLPEPKENSELSYLLEHERENIRKLELRISKKDEIISNMNTRQINLTNEINELYKKHGCEQQIEEYKSLVGSLQEKIEKYSNQIAFMQSQSRNPVTPEFKISQLEDFQHKIINLERQNAELLARQNEFNILSLKSKQDTQLITDLNYQIDKKDREIFELSHKNKELLSKITEIQNFHKDSRQEFREFKLKEEINRLKQANDQISEKIAGSRPRNNSKTRERSCSSSNLLSELFNTLKCSKSNVLSTIKKLKNSEKLEIRLEKLIKDLSPKNTELNCKYIWKYIRKVIEEYIVIKKKTENDPTLNKISAILGVSPSGAFDEVKKILEEKKTMAAVVDKIKKMLCLGPHAALREIEDTIDEKV